MYTARNLLFIFSACLLLTTGCSSDGNSSVVSGSTISSLPANTDPVTETSSSSLSQKTIEALAAVTGLSLSSWSDTNNWQSGNSRAMCEIGQALKESLGEAMNPDKIKCYVGAVHSTGAMGNVTIDDGSNVFMRLTNFPESANFEPRIKLRIQKNSAGQITLFEMFSCFDYDGSNYSQSEYILQQINDDLSVTSQSKHTGSDGSVSYGGAAVVTGQLSSSYQWESKSMSLSRYYSDGSNNHSQEVSVTQGASNFLVSGYNAGSFGQDIFSNAFYASVQGLNMSTPKSIALGDGTASYNLDWCYDSDSDSDCADEIGGNRYTQSNIDSWNGDTRVNLSSAADGDYFSAVNGQSVPNVSSISAISYGSSESWDCNAEGDFIDADLANMNTTGTALGDAFAECNAKFEFEDQHSSNGYACDAAQ